MTTGLSRSSTRIRGDDYQHLFTWRQVLDAIVLPNNITKIGIEDPSAGKADDVTVYMKDGKRECYQIKYSVDSRQTAGTEWLTKSGRPGKPSMIQEFHRLWTEHGEDKPEIELVTNRLPPKDDPMMSIIDGMDNTVARHLEHAKPGSKGATTLTKLATHLHVDEDVVVEFLRDVKFTLGMSHRFLVQQVKPFMHVAGLRCDDVAVEQGIGIVRGWVMDGKKEITVDELRQAVKPLRRPDESPTVSILIQMIDRDQVQNDAMIVLDWTGLFPGSEPRVRHLPSDPKLWNRKFRPELHRVARELRSQKKTRVLVKGYMRLPTWFVAGTELGKTAGFDVSSVQGQEIWSSVGGLSKVSIECDAAHVGRGQDLAVGIALAMDPSEAVLEYICGQGIGVNEYVCIRPANGPSNQAISDAAEARYWALKVLDSIRKLAEKHKPRQIHLFMASPHGAMLLLGNLWDRMPSTQTYEDLGSAEGYAPSYLIPG